MGVLNAVQIRSDADAAAAAAVQELADLAGRAR